METEITTDVCLKNFSFLRKILSKQLRVGIFFI